MLSDTSIHSIFKGTVLAFFFLLLPVATTAHNVDGNGQEGLAEAIHALQVAAGMEPDSSSPTGTAQPSQVLSGVTFSNENESGLVGEYNGRTGTAQAAQVFSGVTFSNESESDLVGAYHGPPGCYASGAWHEVVCYQKCWEKHSGNTDDYISCRNYLCDQISRDMRSWYAIQGFCM